MKFPLQSIKPTYITKCIRPSISTQNCYCTKVKRFDGIFSAEIKKRCQKFLHLDEKLRVMPWMKGKDLKTAAVLVPLCTVDGEPSLLYTVRSSKLNTHKGEVSFPGGIHDADDLHMIQTALRETNEEIGLDPKIFDVWGQMTPVPGKNFEIAVTPIIAYCGEINVDILELNKDEVDSVFTVTLAKLCDPCQNGYTLFKKGGYQLPVYTGGKHRIWGLTAIITHMTLRQLVNDKKIYSLEIHGGKRMS